MDIFSSEEIAEKMGVTEERVHEILKIAQDPVSLETPIGEEEDSHLGDFIEDEKTMTPSDSVAFTMLKDQLLIFDNKEKVKISYVGMEDALVMAPKPQLIRVFVNLITNAVQAVEIQQKEAEERGEETVRGEVLICLRNSIKDGYYDVVVDDNGPGVSEENQNRLFTPNFTTKSSGTGLGLAICRNIIEKCDGEIGYQKSFALGGASFSVTLPKHQEA